MTVFLKLIRQAPWSARFGMLVIATYAVLAVFAPVLTPFGESEIVATEFEPWGEEYILGTDNLGRDMLTRLIYGARNTIGIAFLTTCLAFVIGGFAGFMAAALGGWTDQVLGRLVDVLMAIPQLIFALLDSTRVFRLARAVAMNIVVMDFVEVARLRGEGLWWVMRREVLPNAMPPVVAEFGLRFCFVFLFISALSFLGLGI